MSKHTGSDIGEFLHLHGILPPQLEEDADVVESFLPAAFVEEIDAIETVIDDRPTKKSKTSSRSHKVTKTAGTASRDYTMRRRSPKFKKRSYRSRSAPVESHVNDVNLVNATHATNTLFTKHLTVIAQGDDINTRTGNKIAVKGVAVSMEFETLARPAEVFLIRPSNTNVAPAATDFDFVDGPGKMLKSDKGWVIRKYTIDPVFRKTLDVFIPVKVNCTYQTGSNNPLSNQLHLCIYNDSGATIKYTGIARLIFHG